MYTRCDNSAFVNFVAAISRTNSNWFEFVRLIAATKFCRSDNDFHEINRVTQGGLLRRLVPATCRSDLSPSVSRPLLIKNDIILSSIQRSRAFFILTIISINPLKMRIEFLIVAALVLNEIFTAEPLNENDRFVLAKYSAVLRTV